MVGHTVTLASGKKMPLVGLGLWKVPKETAADTVFNAIKSGYRLFDGAYDYQNEKEAGEGIRRAISDGLVTREENFITTKLWNNYHRREHALAMAKNQNESWGLGYIDLFLMHFPCALKYIDPAVRQYPACWMDDAGTIQADNVPIRETWEAMEEIVDNGIARSIGVSNFQAQSIYDILTYTQYPLSSLQIEHHPYLIQSSSSSRARERHRTSAPNPSSSYRINSPKTKEIPLLFDAEPVKILAAKYKATPVHVLLRWANQRNVAVIPKSNNQTRLAENLDVLGFDMTEDELKSISALDKGLRFNDPGFYLPNHPIRIFA
ncbi:hypothetical protein N7532_003944 [Penicillium argentinense]|uniref:D-xylose reductase [NAD(P)H] n=1 Tax=Penicillium argentinense TaxID=1131581 RepID=A0A9W9FNX1_9EURO|nr:uncharacterized protein N7532_003944 [Penicillium argentinense]KAJ5103415.1 hypothetical protein N7532_003944 [Penicillium argentinense]